MWPTSKAMQLLVRAVASYCARPVFGSIVCARTSFGARALDQPAADLGRGEFLDHGDARRGRDGLHRRRAQPGGRYRRRGGALSSCASSRPNRRHRWGSSRRQGRRARRAPARSRASASVRDDRARAASPAARPGPPRSRPRADAPPRRCHPRPRRWPICSRPRMSYGSWESRRSPSASLASVEPAPAARRSQSRPRSVCPSSRSARAMRS